MKIKLVQYNSTDDESEDHQNGNGVSNGNSNRFQNGNAQKRPRIAEEPSTAEAPKRKKRNFARLSLPIDSVRGQLLEVLQKNETVLIVGETGSGKSTQIPQMCLDAGLKMEGKVAITQPRRVAAVTLAQRVAAELQTDLGDVVGYKVRFDNMVSEQTRVAFLTDGMLLREALHNSMLMDYSMVIIDEAHERSLHTDVLLAVIKLCQQQRRNAELDPLRIVIMSATMDTELYSKYFDGAPVYYIKGRTHPIEMFYGNSLSNNNDDDYVYNSLLTVMRIHKKEPISDGILVFLTGQDEIESAVKRIAEINQKLDKGIVPVPLYAALSAMQQRKAFEPHPPNERKVIFATNIAETSLTIPGIRIVVDSGRVKMKTFTPENSINVLRVVPISKAQANQRAGRAGREAPGKCYRVYSKAFYEKMAPTSQPEILRTNLSTVLLELFSIGLKRVNNLKFIEHPSSSALETAEQELKDLGAISYAVKGKKQRVVLTDVGLKMSRFPVDPPLAKVLLSATQHGCLEEALTVVACLSGESLFAPAPNSADKREAHYNVRRRYETTEGDHVMMLNIYQAFKKQKKSCKDKNSLKRWCNDNGFIERNLDTIFKIRKQLHELCMKVGLKVESCGAQRDRLRMAIAEGLFMNSCEYDSSIDKYRLIRKPAVTLKIHPSSCIGRSRPTVFVFSDLLRTKDLFAKDITLVDRDFLAQVLEKQKQARIQQD
uniref:RNA helicase n=1 Tax=Steinernema glaseri TaxID=37863 RepID=A0A1I8A1K1_9BILA